jgi:hypothetical protein
VEVLAQQKQLQVMHNHCHPLKRGRGQLLVEVSSQLLESPIRLVGWFVIAIGDFILGSSHII